MCTALLEKFPRSQCSLTRGVLATCSSVFTITVLNVFRFNFTCNKWHSWDKIWAKICKIFPRPKANFGIILYIFPTNKCWGAYWRGSIYFNEYGNCVFLILASKNQTVYFRYLDYYLLRSIQNNLFLSTRTKKLDFIWDIWHLFWNTGYLPK